MLSEKGEKGLQDQSLGNQKLKLVKASAPQDGARYKTMRPKAGTDSFMGSDGSWSAVDLGYKWALPLWHIIIML